MLIKNHRSKNLCALTFASAMALTGGCVVDAIDDDAGGAALDEDEDGPSAVGDYATDDDDDDDDVDPDAPGEPHGESAEIELFDVAVGELIEVEEGIVLPVPERGEMFAIEVVYDDGVMTSVTLAHDTEGHVRIVHPDDHLLGVPEGTAAACASKCSDSSYSYVFGNGNPAKWKERLDWYYRHNNSPVGKTAAINAFKNAAAAVPNSRNSCSLADNNNATQRYEGETTVIPGVTTGGGVIGCDATRLQDGTNVIGWGGLPGSTLAVTCTRAIIDGGAKARITDMDMRYDKDRNWFTGNGVPGGCSNRFSLRGVGTHEFGHAYGLGHTSQCNLVMAPATAACTGANRVFGRGDVLGLRTLY